MLISARYWWWTRGSDPTSKKGTRFFSMWGTAYRRRGKRTPGCWTWQGGAARFFRGTLAGATCDRNWLAGAVGGGMERPFSPPSPALLGFDESINEECSRLLGLAPWDNGDLNMKVT